MLCQHIGKTKLMLHVNHCPHYVELIKISGRQPLTKEIKVRGLKIWVLLTNASGALVKEPKSSKFYIEKNITYTLKKLTTQVPKQFYHIP
jgi:hypothetical protein